MCACQGSLCVGIKQSNAEANARFYFRAIMTRYLNFIVHCINVKAIAYYRWPLNYCLKDLVACIK